MLSSRSGLNATEQAHALGGPQLRPRYVPPKFKRKFRQSTQAGIRIVAVEPPVTRRESLSSARDIFTGMEERALRPGWHGIPLSQDRFVPPESLSEPAEGVHWTTEKAPPIWAELAYPGDVVQTVKGSAMARTRELVQVQWVEYSMAQRWHLEESTTSFPPESSANIDASGV